jgi:xylulokinase
LSDRYLLGIDVGTTSTKTAITDFQGKILSHCSSDHELYVPRSGWAEEDPLAWWQGLVRTTKTCLSQSSVDAAEIAGIGVSGQIPTMVLVDKNGKPTRKAILYSDARAIEEMKWMSHEIGDSEVFRTTGSGVQQQLWIPKLLWLKAHDPEALKGAYKMIGSYDYLKLKLTGKFSTDINNALEAGLLDFRRTEWWTGALDRAGISRELLPSLDKPSQAIGEVSKEAAEETGLVAGTPVVAGSGDTVCSALAAGVVEPDDLMLMYGTTGCFLFCTEKALPDPRFYIDYHVVPGMYALSGCMATSGALLRWFKENLAQEKQRIAQEKHVDPYAALDLEAEAIEAGSEGIIILPYFMGEKTPINDPHARGVIFGLTISHSGAHIYRALLEAVAYGFNHQVDLLRQLGCSPKRAVAVNGGARSKIWRQIVTDVLGFPQHYAANNPGAPLGDAFLAGIGTGHVKSWTKIKEWVDVTQTSTPDKKNHELYSNMYRIYRSIYEHLKEDLLDLADIK